MSEDNEDKSSERRDSARKRSFKKGVITFKDRYCSTECMVRNESEQGALLLVSQNQIIPNIFEIKVYPEREFRVAEAMWRTPDAMGIRYLEPSSYQKMKGIEWDGVERREAPEEPKKLKQSS